MDKMSKRDRYIWTFCPKRNVPIGHGLGGKRMSENKAKKVKEIFNDYETKANIKDSYVASLNVMKNYNS